MFEEIAKELGIAWEICGSLVSIELWRAPENGMVVAYGVHFRRL